MGFLLGRRTLGFGRQSILAASSRLSYESPTTAGHYTGLRAAIPFHLPCALPGRVIQRD